MAVVSMRSKRRFLEVFLSALLCLLVFLLQMLVLNYLNINGGICSLPLTLVIVWGLVFGTRLPPLTVSDLRKRSPGEIFSMQLAGGSHSGFLIGWFFSWLYFSIIPVYPLSFPLIGWVAGYFSLRGLGQGNLLAIPMTFILTIVAETVMAWELYLLQRPGVFEHLHSFILPEALLNAIVAPFLYFPMRRIYDLAAGEQATFQTD